MYKFPDADVAKLEKAGFGIVMHAAVWTSPSYLPATPQFLSNASPAELSAKAKQYSTDILEHFKNKIKLYNAFNEPDGGQAYQFTLDELVNLVGSSLQGAKKGDPNTLGFVNISMPIFQYINQGGANYTVAYDMYGNAKPGVVMFAGPASSPTQFVQALTAAGYNPDTIGLEYYYGVVLPPIDLGVFAGSLEHYGALGKKLFISELSYGTLDDYPGLNKWWSGWGGWHQGYTDQAQADWARDALTVAFSKPSVNGVQWTGASDGPVDYNYVGDGLFHSDGVTPRPSLEAIGKAIHSWTTQGSGKTDSSGSLALRGYGGDYLLTITTPDGRTLHGKVHLTEQEQNQTNLVLDATPPVINSASVSGQSTRNGEYLEIKASADATAETVSADVSELDSTQGQPLALEKGPDGTFSLKFPVSVLNSAANGVKTIRISAADSVGNISTKSVQIELNNPPPQLDAVPPDDSFSGTTLDTGKWNAAGQQRCFSEAGRAPGPCGGKQPRRCKRTGAIHLGLHRGLRRPGGFPDRGRLGTTNAGAPGWSHAGSGFQRDDLPHHTRLRSNNQDLFFAWSNQGTLVNSMATTATSGKYRLVRTGGVLALLYDGGEGWKELESVAVPAGQAQVYLGMGDVYAGQAFTTYFDNFKINSGLTTYKP